jgi:hypothetical protein
MEVFIVVADEESLAFEVLTPNWCTVRHVWPVLRLNYTISIN